jgi:hypothetical protein
MDCGVPQAREKRDTALVLAQSGVIQSGQPAALFKKDAHQLVRVRER